MSERIKLPILNFLGGLVGSLIVVGIAIGSWQTKLEAMGSEVKALKAQRETDRQVVEEMRGDVKVIRAIIEERFPRRPIQ
jgi:hypothetical protein